MKKYIYNNHHYKLDKEAVYILIGEKPFKIQEDSKGYFFEDECKEFRVSIEEKRKPQI